MTHLGAGLQGQPKRSGYIGGARQGSNIWMAITPAVLDRDGISVAQQIGAAGNLTITGALVTATGSGKANVNPVGGYGRCVGVFSSGVLTAITFTVYGYDVEGERLVENLTGPNNTTTAGKKAFAIVDRVAASAAVGTNVEVGTIDVFRVPAYLANRNRVVRVGYNNILADDTVVGTGATIVPAVSTNPATAITGDIWGTITPSSATDGAKELFFQMAAPATDQYYGLVRQYGAGIP